MFPSSAIKVTDSRWSLDARFLEKNASIATTLVCESRWELETLFSTGCFKKTHKELVMRTILSCTNRTVVKSRQVFVHANDLVNWTSRWDAGSKHTHVHCWFDNCRIVAAHQRCERTRHATLKWILLQHFITKFVMGHLSHGMVENK